MREAIEDEQMEEKGKAPKNKDRGKKFFSILKQNDAQIQQLIYSSKTFGWK